LVRQRSLDAIIIISAGDSGRAATPLCHLENASLKPRTQFHVASIDDVSELQQ